MAIDHPVPGDFVAEAECFLARLPRELMLTSVVLDHWRGAVRLVYGGPNQHCQSKCSECHLFRTVGTDDDTELKREKEVGVVRFHPTLKRASPADRKFLPGSERCLNCKTVDGYGTFFEEWLVRKCRTETEIVEEVALVAGFRILRADGMGDIAEYEREVKRRIVTSAVSRLRAVSSPLSDCLERRALALGLSRW